MRSQRPPVPPRGIARPTLLLCLPALTIALVATTFLARMPHQSLPAPRAPRPNSPIPASPPGPPVRINPRPERALRCGECDAVLAFSPDGKLLATAAGDGPIRLWEVATGRRVATLRGHRRGVNSLAFSP